MPVSGLRSWLLGWSVPVSGLRSWLLGWLVPVSGIRGRSTGACAPVVQGHVLVVLGLGSDGGEEQEGEQRQGLEHG